MEIKLDLKSLIAGLIAGIVITMTVAAVNSNPQKSAESGSGRFKMLINEKRAYILDSTTGKPWSVSSGSRQEDKDQFWKTKLNLLDDVK